MKPGLVVDARIWDVFGGVVMVLDGALFVALPASFEQAAPSVASARFWIPSALFGHTVGCGKVRESTVV